MASVDHWEPGILKKCLDTGLGHTALEMGSRVRSDLEADALGYTTTLYTHTPPALLLVFASSLYMKIIQFVAVGGGSRRPEATPFEPYSKLDDLDARHSLLFLNSAAVVSITRLFLFSVSDKSRRERCLHNLPHCVGMPVALGALMCRPASTPCKASQWKFYSDGERLNGFPQEEEYWTPGFYSYNI